MNVASIKTAASEATANVKSNRFVKKAQAIATSDTAKSCAIVGVASVGLGVAYALFVKSAEVAHAAMS